MTRCDTCQAIKYDPRVPMGLLQYLPIPELIWEDNSMDFIEGLPRSKHWDAILVVEDWLSKYAHFIGIKHPFIAKSIAHLIVNEVVKHHGIARSIISDLDRIFMSILWKEIFTLQGTQLKASSSYHPQTDDQTEVVNHTLEQYLRCFCHNQQSRWVDYLV